MHAADDKRSCRNVDQGHWWKILTRASMQRVLNIVAPWCNSGLTRRLGTLSFLCHSNVSSVTMNGEPDLKRPNMDVPKIGTHDGTFHCDEVLACHLLKQLSEYKNATVVRTRNPELLKTCDIVVDVGGEYDPSRHLYDHHQRSFDGSMKSLSPVPKPWVTKLSSAGLVYLHFGHRILAQILGAKREDEIVEKLFDKIYENFVEEVDAIDNGISVCPDAPRYLITTNMSARVGHLNPYWNDKEPNTEERFDKALALVGQEFMDRVEFYAKAWWPARELVKVSIEQRFKVDEGGEIMELSAAGYPWKDHMFTLEEETNLSPTLKYVIFQDGGGSWRVQAVPISKNSFELRIPLLEEWRGLRDEELSEKSGIPGGIFVHTTGFIGGNKTREGALKMAQETLIKHAQAAE